MQVFVNGDRVATVYRGDAVYTTTVPSNAAVLLLVENMGRLNYGRGMTDPKGILVGDVLWTDGAESYNATYTVSSIPLLVCCSLVST